MRSVSCGGDHTSVITESGKVYTFGQSYNGQLGLGTHQLEADTPTLLTSLVSSIHDSGGGELEHGVGAGGHQVEQISCGEAHTSFVTTSGLLLTCGDGRHGKLCLDTETLSNHYR